AGTGKTRSVPVSDAPLLTRTTLLVAGGGTRTNTRSTSVGRGSGRRPRGPTGRRRLSAGDLVAPRAAHRCPARRPPARRRGGRGGGRGPHGAGAAGREPVAESGCARARYVPRRGARRPRGGARPGHVGRWSPAGHLWGGGGDRGR